MIGSLRYNMMKIAIKLLHQIPSYLRGFISCKLYCCIIMSDICQIYVEQPIPKKYHKQNFLKKYDFENVLKN